MPAVMNAADEVCVGAFLDGKISFTDIFRIVTSVVEAIEGARSIRTLDGIIAADREARAKALEMIK